jgi:hypothetical protein
LLALSTVDRPGPAQVARHGRGRRGPSERAQQDGQRPRPRPGASVRSATRRHAQRCSAYHRSRPTLATRRRGATSRDPIRRRDAAHDHPGAAALANAAAMR